jgi:hypothetical protein
MSDNVINLSIKRVILQTARLNLDWLNGAANKQLLRDTLAIFNSHERSFATLYLCKVTEHYLHIVGEKIIWCDYFNNM